MALGSQHLPSYPCSPVSFELLTSPCPPELGDEGAACSPISITDSGLQITQCHL